MRDCVCSTPLQAGAAGGPQPTPASPTPEAWEVRGLYRARASSTALCRLCYPDARSRSARLFFAALEVVRGGDASAANGPASRFRPRLFARPRRGGPTANGHAQTVVAHLRHAGLEAAAAALFAADVLDVVAPSGRGLTALSGDIPVIIEQ